MTLAMAKFLEHLHTKRGHRMQYLMKFSSSHRTDHDDYLKSHRPRLEAP